jgi:TRAP-type C4-dicarboxylate transport system substrate-binding protein
VIAARRSWAAIVGLVAASVAIVAAPRTTDAQSTWEMNIGSLAPKGTPWTDMLEKLEKNIESKSGGRINVVIRPPGVMAEIEMVRETRKGERLQGCGVTTAAIAEGGNVPQLQLVELPFLFESNDEADYVLDNVLFQPMSETLARRGFVLGLWSENGWRSFATKAKPIRTPADLKGVKMRSQESDVHLGMYQAFGAVAVQKPMTEVMTALQSNVVDGLDNTALYIQSAGLAEPLDYFTTTRHIYQPAAIIFSKLWFDQLPPDLQALVLESKQFTAEGRAAIRAEEAAMMENFSAFGVELIEPTAADRDAFEKVGRTMHASFAATIEDGPTLLGKIQAALTALRG